MAYGGTLPVCAYFLWVAMRGDHAALVRLAGEPDFPWYAGTAAVVVLYHGLEHFYDEVRAAARRSVRAVEAQSPVSPGDKR
jgi:hypothetical protein